MSKLSWVTPSGTIANMLIGIPTSVGVQVIDGDNTGLPVTFTIVSGALPAGLTLDSATGVISGTPGYTVPADSYIQTKIYTFKIRAVRSDGITPTVLGTTTSDVDREFSIIATNIVNNDFNWITPAGSLGTVPNGEFYSLPMVAETNDLSTLTFKVISGSLPPGMQVLEKDVIYNKNIQVSVTQPAPGRILTLTASVGIPIGSKVTGRSIPDNTVVTSIDIFAKTVTLNNSTTAPVSATAIINFYAIEFKAGTLVGVPTILDPVAVNQSEVYRFSVRATTPAGHVNDRNFSLSVTNVYGPVIKPDSPLQYTYDPVSMKEVPFSFPPGIVTLGSIFDGSHFSQQLSVVELNPNVQIQWSIVDGNLPAGITLSDTGLLSGYAEPLQLVGAFGPAGYDGDTTDGDIITAQQQYDFAPYDFNQLNQSLSYNFTVRAYDGATYDLQEYYIEVVSRSGYTADSTNLINDQYLTVDALSKYTPIIRNTISVLPTARQNSYYAFKFDGYDFQNDELTYSLVNSVGTFDAEVIGVDDGFDYNGDNLNHLSGVGFDSWDGSAGVSNLPGVILDSASGWIYGNVSAQSASLTEYTFGVVVSKTRDAITLSSEPRYFTLPVLGDVNDTVKWITNTNLGTIENGSISDISIKAVSTEGKDLVYSLIDAANIPCQLPQGLKLITDTEHNLGLLSGRVSFETFSIDGYATTFDNNKLTADRTYNFYVKAETVDGTSSSTQEFTIKLNVINTKPYNNLYLKALPTHDQRQIYRSLVTNEDIFVPSLIYRPTDPYYGVQSNIKMLFMSGLSPKELNDYELAIANNHYNKNYTFGDIKTAVVLDDFYKVKYEVVYIDVIDPELNSNGHGAPLEINLDSVIANPYIDSAGDQYKTLYPNSSEDMTKRIQTSVGYQDQSSLPSWMTSNQPGVEGSSTFMPPLGFVKAVVMAYTVPGASKLIAYRLKTSGVNFNNIKFDVDRYQVENFYSTNFNYSAGKYISGIEATFDRLPKNVGHVVASVKFGLTIPFDQVNGRPVSYINANLGLDGKTDWENGDTLIFLQQENFFNVGLYNGWVNYTDSWIGDNILTPEVEGYDVQPYDTYTVIPGYLEKVQGTAAQNQRGGIWRISIVNGVVNLVFVQEVNPNDRIQIIRGTTYGAAVVFYNPILTVGQSVPRYDLYRYAPPDAIRRTTFNNNTTRFFSKRDQYYEPESQDKYLKFPQYGVFN